MARTPFLTGAIASLYGGELPDACPRCGYDWATSFATACELVATSPDRIAATLEGHDGHVAQPDGSWNATAYVWHLVDLCSGWAERWQQLLTEPGWPLVPWDPDVLADARGYRLLPTAPSLWALDGAVDRLLEATADVGSAAGFEHAEWGAGNVRDTLVWLGHEFFHHELDIRERVG